MRTVIIVGFDLTPRKAGWPGFRSCGHATTLLPRDLWSIVPQSALSIFSSLFTRHIHGLLSRNLLFVVQVLRDSTKIRYPYLALSFVVAPTPLPGSGFGTALCVFSFACSTSTQEAPPCAVFVCLFDFAFACGGSCAKDQRLATGRRKVFWTRQDDNLLRAWVSCGYHNSTRRQRGSGRGLRETGQKV